MSNDPQRIKIAEDLFEREAKVLHSLNDHNRQIPKFYANFPENQDFYLVQEFITGNNLAEELRQRTRLKKEDVVELLKDVLEILQFIHSDKINIIHRDIKPENLMKRDQDGKIVLIDFGAVKEVLAQAANTSPRQTPTRIYTENYAPREQRQGYPQPNSDIYALGITAIQAWMGKEPQNLKDYDTGEIIWNDDIEFKDPLAKILEKMVHENYRHRYQSADEVLNDIKEYQGTHVVSPRSTQPGGIQPASILSRPNIPQWLKFLFIAAVGTSILVGIVKVFMNHAPPIPTPQPTNSSEKLPSDCPPFIPPKHPCLQQKQSNSK
jgi:serine/threonine protein kinase